MMVDFYATFPTTSFSNSFSQAIDQLNQIGNGKQSGEAYKSVVRQLWTWVHYGRLTRFGFETQQQTRFALAALVQEPGEMGDKDEGLLSQLIKKSRFKALLDELLAFEEQYIDVNAAKQRLTPKLLNLYYQRYFSFEAGIADEAVRSALLEPLKQMLQRYNGRHRMTVLAKSNMPLLDSQLDKVLSKFDDLKPLDDIRSELILNNNHEIFHRLRLIRLLANIRALQANQYDAHVKQLFIDVKQYPYVWANTSRLILEECVREMLLKCQKSHAIGSHWQQFIFETIGDPRASKNVQAWQRVGVELHLWYRGILSRGDLREFLETMTDGQGDTIYQYRKQFWLQYIDYVVNAKVMLGSKTLSLLRKQAPDIWQRFKNNPETYSQLNKADHSCVFIDFGSFCVIEGTHKSKLRIYSSCPINLTNHHYDYSGFYIGNASRLLLCDFVHNSNEILLNGDLVPTYSWQNKVRLYLNQWMNPKINLDDIMLVEHLKPSVILKIRDYLLRNGQNPN